MKTARPFQKEIIIRILESAFADNLSVNYIVKQDRVRQRRIRHLMEYSYDYCSLFGEVLISEDENACALIVYPDKKKTTLKSILLDLKLILKCVGLKNLKKTIRREALIKSHHPKVPMTYLWFIGVDITEQHNGYGSALLDSILSHSEKQGRIVCLETSTRRNIPWYKRFGFEIYAEEDLSYRLYFLKKDHQK